MAQTYIGAPVRRREDVRFLTGKAVRRRHQAPVHAPRRHPAQHAGACQDHGHRCLASARHTGRGSCFQLSRYCTLCQTHSHPALPPGRSGAFYSTRSPMKVRYVGEPVAVAVASSRYVAEDALDAIAVRYEALPWYVCRTPGAMTSCYTRSRARIWRRSTPSTSVISTRPGRPPTTLAQPPLPCTGTRGIHWKHVVWLPAIMPTVAN